MATWGAHIRVAENILKLRPDLEEKAFLVGNLGPDCNEANEDWTEFVPPKKVTHWFNENNKIELEKFYNKYLKGRCYEDKGEESFLIGYYSHLISDIEWFKMVRSQGEHNNILKRMKIDKRLVQKVKKDWYDLDHLYFRDNKESIFYRVLKYISEFPEYLDYFPRGAIIKKLKYIVEFYDTFQGELDREYKYLTEKELNDYVESTTKVIAKKFYDMGIGFSR